MRQSLWAAGAIFGFVLMSGGFVQAAPPEPGEKPAVADDDRPPPPRNGPRPEPNRGRQYSLEQATSDQAQLHTIAFDGLAFLTGDFGSDTFLPPGKVSDYFGFQYMRDIDARGGGHNTSFLTRIALNMLATLSDAQKSQLLTLAKQQESDIKRFAEMRLPLMKAFRRNLKSDLPAGSNGLDRGAVVKYSTDLYEVDGLLAFGRAKVMGGILHSLNARQRAALARLKFGDSGTWPDVPEQIDRQSMSHTVHVAVMTYASEMFAWYAGSLEADTYFCPERHGMYFGGFGMKTAPAMGKKNYSISTTLTGDKGEVFLTTLNDAQRKLITDVVDLQRNTNRDRQNPASDSDRIAAVPEGPIRQQGQGTVLIGEIWRIGWRDFVSLRHGLCGGRQNIDSRPEARISSASHVQRFRSKGTVPVLVPNPYAEDQEHGFFVSVR